jgi:hypothetical protein
MLASDDPRLFQDDNPFLIPRGGALANYRNKFRARKVWKDFRAGELKARGFRCELCHSKHSGAKSSFLNLHHLDPDNYEDLTPSKFRLLCAVCHDEIVETWITRLNGSVFRPGILFPYWYFLLRDFLTYKARDRGLAWLKKIENGEL